jgi:hypothetical protein
MSRVPCLKSLPVAGKIATPTSAVASTQGSVYSFAAITVADYASSPCVCIGGFFIQKRFVGGSPDWQVFALDDNVGIGLFMENFPLSIGVGTFGAAAATYFTNNGGTAPIPLTTETRWYLSRDGFYKNISAHVTNNGSGAGAVSTQLAIPYLPEITAVNSTLGTGQATLNGTGNTLMVYSNAGSTNVFFLLNNSGAFLANSQFTGVYGIAYSFQMKISEA